MVEFPALNKASYTNPAKAPGISWKRLWNEYKSWKMGRRTVKYQHNFVLS